MNANNLSIKSREVINKKALISYIQIHLFLGIRFKYFAFETILAIVAEKEDHLQLNLKDLYEIFHTKLVLENIQISSLNVAVSNNDVEISSFILKLERKLHLQDLNTVQKCLKENVHRMGILRQKLNNNLRNFGIRRIHRFWVWFNALSCWVWFNALIFVLPTFWFKLSNLKFSYRMYKWYSNLSENSTQWNDVIKSYSNETFKMKEYDEYYNYTNEFIIAKWYTLAVIVIDIALYISGIILVPTTWIDKLADENNKERQKLQELELQTWLSIDGMKDICSLETKWWLSVKWIFFHWLKIFSKLLWPIMLIGPHQILYSLIQDPSKIFISHSRCRNLVFLFNYIHIYIVGLIHVIIPMWILLPLLGIMSNLSVFKLISEAFAGIADNLFFHRESDPAISFIGHIFWLNIFVIANNSSRRVRIGKLGSPVLKRILHVILIFITSTLQMISRFLVFQNLMLLLYSGLTKYTTFCLIHFSWLLITRIVFETRQKKFEFKINRLRKTILTILSCLCSTVFLVDVHTLSSRTHYSDHNMLTQISFYILILLENLVLTILPLVEPSLFPNSHEFNQEVFKTNFWVVNTFWLIVIILEVSLFSMY